MIEAAVVGLGRWGRTLVASVQAKSERLRFSRAVARHPAAHRDFARANGLELTQDLAAVLRHPATQAVVLATPHSQHLEQILAVAAARKAVFCEKPLTLTKVDAERAVAACEAAGVVLGVGTDKRFFPAMEELTRIVKSGELGPLLHLEANFSNEVAAAMTSAWRHDPEESPAGGLTGTGIHVLDALVRLAGPVRRVEAQLISLKPPPDPHDTLSVLLEFESGVSGILAAVRSTPAFWRVHAFGRRGSAEARGRNELILRGSRAEPRQLSFPDRDSVRASLEAFAEAVAGIAPYPIPSSEIVATVAAFEAITKAVAK